MVAAPVAPAMRAPLIQKLGFNLRLLAAGSRRPVVTWVDAFYAPATCVMLQSLYSSNPHNGFDTLIFTPKGETSAAQPIFAPAFEELRRRFDRRIVLREADDRLLRRLRLSEHMRYLNQATYGNLLLPELVPASSYLYLDSDLVVQEDIAPLLNLELGDALIAGVPDFGPAMEWQERLGIGDADTYVNNGMLVVNADAARKEKLFLQALHWHDRLGDRAVYVDQDLLNVIAIGRKHLLESKWNVMQHALYGKLDTLDPETFKGIFHFTWIPKPWAADAHPRPRALYERYARAAPMRM